MQSCFPEGNREEAWPQCAAGTGVQDAVCKTANRGCTPFLADKNSSTAFSKGVVLGFGIAAFLALCLMIM